MAEVFGILVMPDEHVIKKKAEYKIDCRGETEIPLED